MHAMMMSNINLYSGGKITWNDKHNDIICGMVSMPIGMKHTLVIP